jgi:hypothetical protein
MSDSIIDQLFAQALIPPSRDGDPAPAQPGAATATGRDAPLQILHAADLGTLPPRRWLVPAELPAQALAVLYGPAGAGKSHLALDYALRLAQRVTVLYVAAEGAHGYAARTRAWCSHFQAPPGQLWFVPEAVNVLQPGEVDRLIAAAGQVSPALIILDTLARCMLGGDENSARDMGLLVAACDRLRQASGATVLLVHHSGKNGLGERGSSALRAAADQMLELAADDGTLSVACAKSKDSKPFERRWLRLLPVETGQADGDGRPETSCVLVPAAKITHAGELTPTGRQILETLALETFAETGAKAATLQSILQLKHATLYAALSTLMRNAYVTQAQRGDPYYITERGKAAV